MRSWPLRWISGQAMGSLLAIGLLSGCGAGGTPGFEPESATPYSLSSIGNLLAFNKLFPGSAPLPQSDDNHIDCPVIEVLDGTASVRTYAGADQSNSNVRYQFSLGETARECSKVGDQIFFKVGAEGRVLLGPAGAPGAFTVPIRVAVRNDVTQKVLTSQLARVPASVAPGDTQTSFTYVSDQIAVPALAHPEDDYTILIGFDPNGRGVDQAKNPRRKRRG